MMMSPRRRPRFPRRSEQGGREIKKKPNPRVGGHAFPQQIERTQGIIRKRMADGDKSEVISPIEKLPGCSSRGHQGARRPD